jgi:hypothetical protein
MRSGALIVVFAMLFFIHNPALASGKAADLGGPVTLDGELAAQSVFGSEKGLNGRANITLTAEISQNVRAVLLFRIQQGLIQQGIEPQKVENLLSEAYIRIDNVGGKPVAFVLGKQTIPFGNLQPAIVNEEIDPIDKISNQAEVIGFTVELEKTGFFDMVEASIFETKEGDLSLGDLDGASIRVTKALTDQWKVVASTMFKGQGQDTNDFRQSVGFVFADGSWTLWAEGVHMLGNSNYPDSHWMAHVGAQYQIDKRQRVVVTSTYVSQAITRLGVAYEIEVIRDTFVSPELAYVLKSDGSGEWQTVVRTEFRFTAK